MVPEGKYRGVVDLGGSEVDFGVIFGHFLMILEV